VNNHPSETKRLADAVTGMAATIAEIIDAQVQKTRRGSEFLTIPLLFGHLTTAQR